MSAAAYERILNLMRSLRQDLNYEECIMLSARFEQCGLDKKKQEVLNAMRNNASPKPPITITRCGK